MKQTLWMDKEMKVFDQSMIIHILLIFYVAVTAVLILAFSSPWDVCVCQ